MMRSLLLGWLLACCATAAAAAAPDAPAQVLVLVRMPPSHFRPDDAYGGGYAGRAARAAGRRTVQALARSYGLAPATDWPLPAIGLDCYVLDVPPQLQAAAVAGRLTHEPGVAWAQVMHAFHLLGHDDPLFPQQPAAAEWHLAELHRSVMGRGVRVAVIDSAVQADHPDLAGQFALRANFVPDQPAAAELHGTAVAGIIAASADNHVGIAGVAPLARLLALRACWQADGGATWCSSLSLALALAAALEADAQVLNLSLGGPPDRLLQALIEAAQARGMAVVAARDEASSDGGFPAALPGVIAVGSRPSPGLAQGLVAPGRDAMTTLPGSRWGIVSGPSYAAAHVSGLLALLLEAQARAGRRPVRAAWQPRFVIASDGRIDACATLAAAGAGCSCSCGATAMTGSTARP